MRLASKASTTSRKCRAWHKRRVKPHGLERLSTAARWPGEHDAEKAPRGGMSARMRSALLCLRWEGCGNCFRAAGHRATTITGQQENNG